jgi:linoleoyl-CoA desaturase
MDTTGSTLTRGTANDLTIAEAMRPTPDELAQARRRLHRQALFMGLLVVVSYWVLVLTHHPVVVTIVSAGALALGLYGVATCVFHDGNHASFSTSRTVNRLAGYTGDLMGASSWIWRFKHNNLHHGNTNVVGYDADIEQAPFARLTPEQRWHPWHRYQHLYMWFLYGFLTLQWFLISDFVDLVNHGIGGREFPRRPRRRDVVSIGMGKLLHLSWAVIVPLLFHRWWTVVVVYVAISWTVGLLLATTFQLAHCTSLVEFPGDDGPRRGPEFVQHQLRTTADFGSARNPASRAVHWFMGGLDQQVEHHLAPRLPHTAYPVVRARLAAACTQQQTAVRAHPGTISAIRAHGAWLRAMGRRPVG